MKLLLSWFIWRCVIFQRSELCQLRIGNLPSIDLPLSLKVGFVLNFQSLHNLLDTLKPEGWRESGKRVKRGLYRTAQNIYINADCNGAANILRKVATTLGFDLSRVGRGALTTPLRFRLWALKESHVLLQWECQALSVFNRAIALKPIQNHLKILLLIEHLTQRLVFTNPKNNP
jgi:hypothetical protein